VALFLSPSQALPKDANNRFNLATDSGRALYDHSTKSQYPESEHYNCDPYEMFTLLHLLGDRAAEMNWNDDDQSSGILWIPEDTKILFMETTKTSSRHMVRLSWLRFTRGRTTLRKPRTTGANKTSCYSTVS
jgi:hypothetical protein